MVAEPLASDLNISPWVLETFAKFNEAPLLKVSVPVLAIAKLAVAPLLVLNKKCPVFVKSTLTNVKVAFGFMVTKTVPVALKVTRPVPKVAIPVVMVKAPDKVDGPVPKLVVPLVLLKSPATLIVPDPKVVVPLLLLNEDAAVEVVVNAPAPNVVVPSLTYELTDKVPVFAMLAVVEVLIVKAPETVSVNVVFMVNVTAPLVFPSIMDAHVLLIFNVG